MPPKLIATEFTYRMHDEHGPTRRMNGSYLGRKIATRATLRRFINANERCYGLGRRIAELVIGGHYTSRWIAK